MLGWGLCGATLLSPAIADDLTAPGSHRGAALYDSHVRWLYRNTSQYLLDDQAISLEGTPAQVLQLSDWLDRIVAIPQGYQTLRRILDSGNHLTIRHSDWALLSSGRTLAPVTADLTNGLGADILILFDARIPDSGSHVVEDAHGHPIPFTAVQNLYHELAHAEHMVTGSWRYWDSEGQAIEAENRFRRGQHQSTPTTRLLLRSGVNGQKVWWPSAAQQTALAAEP